MTHPRSTVEVANDFRLQGDTVRRAGMPQHDEEHRAADYADSVAHLLQSDQTAVADRWWRGPHSDFVLDLAEAGPFVVVLAGVIEVLREGVRDPRWVLGTTTAKGACRVVREWLAAGIEPGDVADWLRAGCYDARWARTMHYAGIDPAELLDDGGRPLHMVEEGPECQGLPLAQAVTEQYVDIGWALRFLSRAQA